jgi:hypothetical protein
MRSQFIISHGLFNFLVSINKKTATVKTFEPCKYQKEFCDRLAKSHEMIITCFLRRRNTEQDIYSALVNYHIERKWSVSEGIPG